MVVCRTITAGCMPYAQVLPTLVLVLILACAQAAENAPQLLAFASKDCSGEVMAVLNSNVLINMCTFTASSILVPASLNLATFRHCHDNITAADPALTHVSSSGCVQVQPGTTILPIFSISEICDEYAAHVQYFCANCLSECETATKAAAAIVETGICANTSLQALIESAGLRCDVDTSATKQEDDRYKPTRSDKIVGFCLFGVGGVLAVVSITGLSRECLKSGQNKQQQQQPQKQQQKQQRDQHQNTISEPSVTSSSSSRSSARAVFIFPEV